MRKSARYWLIIPGFAWSGLAAADQFIPSVGSEIYEETVRGEPRLDSDQESVGYMRAQGVAQNRLGRFNFDESLTLKGGQSQRDKKFAEGSLGLKLNREWARQVLAVELTSTHSYDEMLLTRIPLKEQNELVTLTQEERLRYQHIRGLLYYRLSTSCMRVVVPRERVEEPLPRLHKPAENILPVPAEEKPLYPGYSKYQADPEWNPYLKMPEEADPATTDADEPLTETVVTEDYSCVDDGGVDVVVLGETLDRGVWAKTVMGDVKYERPLGNRTSLLAGLNFFEYRFGEEVSNTLGPDLGVKWGFGPLYTLTVKTGARRMMTAQQKKVSQSWGAELKKELLRGKVELGAARAVSPGALGGLVLEDGYTLKLTYNVSLRGQLQFDGKQTVEEEVSTARPAERRRSSSEVSYLYGLGKPRPGEKDRTTQEVAVRYLVEDLKVKAGIKAQRSVATASYEVFF